MRSSDWSSDVCSSELEHGRKPGRHLCSERPTASRQYRPGCCQCTDCGRQRTKRRRAGHKRRRPVQPCVRCTHYGGRPPGRSRTRQFRHPESTLKTPIFLERALHAAWQRKGLRSEERRLGKEFVSTVKFGWSPG